MKYRKWMGIAGVAAIALLGTANAWADAATLGQCLALSFRKHYKAAFPACKQGAAQGDASAQFYLGWMYDYGRGVQQDYAEALKWYRKAAEQGDDGAQFHLGLMYANGLGVQQNYDEAAKWWRKAAEQGNAAAQFGLGMLYADGQGVMQSGAVAADWYYKAGLSYLKEGNREWALQSAESIKKLGNIPNAFLADRLLSRIYGGKAK